MDRSILLMCYFCLAVYVLFTAAMLIYPMSVIVLIPLFGLLRKGLGVWLGKQVYDEWRGELK